MVAVPDITLNNGVTIPQLGFGVYQVPPKETAAAVRTALDIGYRHIDTAEMYRNEAEVGRAIHESGIDPAEIFVTSKLNNGFHAYDAALSAFEDTMTRLGLPRLDLFLIHWPLPTVSDYTETWRALEKLYQDGRVRAIGVSNFQIAHLRKLHAETEIPPAVNQIELHPYLTQEPLRAFDEEHGIATEAWSPIAQGAVLSDPTVIEMASRYDRTAAQVVLRWHIQLGNIVFPKSVTPARVKENFEIFDFELTDADVSLISGLNKDARTGPDPDTFDYLAT
ncbi:MAG: 2,5-didehydrogluconate reductase [Frankiales bacterium]|jgi:2,5-diketo-D-gluconate reductase A|nr:2,5-didehydrogluconate reductase [Frankiales bacterium]